MKTNNKAENTTQPVDAKPKVLVFCRFYLAQDFRKNVDPLDDEFDFSFLTDGHSPGAKDTREEFYDTLNRGVRCDELGPEDEENILTRCRLLRNLLPDRGRQMMHAMATTLAANLDRIEYSNDVVHESDAVVIGGGSIGIEATLRGKPIFTFCSAAYWFIPSRATWLDLRQVKIWPEQIAAVVQRFIPMTDSEKSSFIKGCLRTTVRQRTTSLYRWPLIDSDDLRCLLVQLVRWTSRNAMQTPEKMANSARRIPFCDES